MSVHYKFKSARSYDNIAFDGLHISVRDLKKAILHQKQIGKSTDFDLQITNAHSNEDYTDDSALIPKNSSLIVSRIPLTAQQKKAWEKSDAAQQHLINLNKGDSPDHLISNKYARSADLTSVDASEEDKIQAAIHQSTRDYDPSNYVRIKNSNQVGEVPPSYRCYKCMQPGHWIKDCKLNSNQDASVEIKKSTGIPRSFMVPVDGPEVPGAMMTPTGHFAVPTIDHEARREMPKKASEPFIIDKPPIPDDLVCGVCKDLLTDAVMIPCCGNSFCDECVRNVLLESEDHQCPDCKEKDVSPDTLIPSRFLRNCVNNFRNQTGYTRTIPLPVHSSRVPAQEPAAPPVQPIADQSTTVHSLVPPGIPPPVPGSTLQIPPNVPSHVHSVAPPHIQPTIPHHVLSQPPPPIVPSKTSSVATHPPGIPPPLGVSRQKPGLPPTSVPPPGHLPNDSVLTSHSNQQPVTIEVPDGDDDVRPGSPAGKSIPSLSTPLPHSNPYVTYNVNHKPPFLAQTAGAAGQPPLGAHSYPPPYRGRVRGDGMYNLEHWGGGRGRGYPGNMGSGPGPLRPHNSQASSHPSVPPPPQLLFTQGGGYVFQPLYPPGTRHEPNSDERSDPYRGRTRPLGNGDPLEMFEKLMKEKDSRKRRPRSRSRSYSRSYSRSRSPRWSPGRSRSRSPKARTRSPKARSRSPKVRSRSPKVRSRSPLTKRSSPLKRSPQSKRSPVKTKAPARPRSRSPHKRTASRSRSRSPYTKRRSRSRSRSKSYYSSRYYERGDRKYKSDSRSHKPTVRSSVYKTHDYGTSHEHSRYADRYERDYAYSRNYTKSYENVEWDPKIGTDWETVRDREMNLIRMENYETYSGDRRERELSANRIIQDLIERDKERDRINDREERPLPNDHKSPDSTKDRTPEKEKKNKKDKKRKRDDSDKKKKKKKPKDKEEKEKRVAEEDREQERVTSTVHKTEERSPDSQPRQVIEENKYENPDKKLEKHEVSDRKSELPLKKVELADDNQDLAENKPDIEGSIQEPPFIEANEQSKETNKPIAEPDLSPNEVDKLDHLNADDLYKDLGANVDMKPFENLKEDKPESPAKKIPDSDSKDVMLAPVPELSKWEKDEEMLLSQNDIRPLELDTTDDLEDLEEEKQVTSEVLKRAENAIFKKGVNPIKEASAKVVEKKEKKEKDDKRDKEDKKDVEEKKIKEERREDRRDREEKREREDKRERDEKREERERRREIEKRERERIVHKESSLMDQYYKDPFSKELKPVKSVALPMKMDLDDSSRRRKAERIVLPEKEKTARISAKQRLGEKVEDKSSKRDCKYGKIPKSDQEVVARVLHRDHHIHPERKIPERKVLSLKGKDELKKELKRKGSMERGYVFNLADEERLIKQSLTAEADSTSKRRSPSYEVIAPAKKKSKPSPQPDSSDEGSSDESVETPKKHKKKKKSKKKKKNKKKSKSKHESSSDSGSSSSSTDSDSEEEGKKKKKHKHKSRKKSKKHKKSKK